MSTVYTAGIHPSIPMADYLADPCPAPSLSSGCAYRLLSRSPMHAWQEHPRLGGAPRDESEIDEAAEDDEAKEQAATLVGKIAHELLLGGDGKLCIIDPADHRSEPKRKGEEGTIPKGWTNGAIKAARAEAISNGLLPILPRQMAASKRMEIAARKFIQSAGVGEEHETRERLRRIFDTGQGEVTLIWQEGKLWFRARPDWINYEQRVMLHYKTTKASAAAEPFTRGIMESMGYDVALAFYRRGFEVLTKQKDWLHLILVQEQVPPHACSLVTLDSVKWAIADDKVADAIEKWSACLASNRWPAYPGCINYAAPRPWEMAELEVSYG